MSVASADSRWIPYAIEGVSYRLLDLGHPSIDEVIMAEMARGTAVYYDRRWEITDHFGAWLLRHPEWMAGKRILVLGAGVGLETVILGQHAAHLWINDLSLVSLDLCHEQLAANGITGVTRLPGLYETIQIPEVDLVVGCFLVYNRETRAAMQAFCQRHKGPVILVNETLSDFRGLLAELGRPVDPLFSEGPARGCLLPGLPGHPG